MRKINPARLCAVACFSVFLCIAALITQTALAQNKSAQPPKPKHINRAIELLEQGQPVYYTGSHSGTTGTFEQGKQDAQTYADYISYDMEHAPFDVAGLAEYMKGLVAGGPTSSGHRTPAVIVNVPVNGTDEAAVRANAWMFSQVLATGVHGIMLTHADTPGAIRAFVEAVRLPIHKQGLDKGINEGRRGVHGAPTAAAIWGITQEEYLDKADAWPLNPEWRTPAGRKAGRQIRSGQRGRESESSRHRFRGVGAQRHGVVAGRPRSGRGARSHDGGGARQSLRRL